MVRWQTKKLDDACEVEYGTRVVNKKHGGSKYPVYGGGGATFFMDRSNRENRMVVARFAMSEQCTRFVAGEFFLNDSGLTISPKSKREISQDFLDWQMLFLNDKIYSLARGSAQKNLDVPAFRNMQISFPESFDEQKRVVKKLNDIFKKVTQAKENSEKNLQNAKELFTAHLNSLFSEDRENTRKIGEVTKICLGLTHTPKYVSEGVPFLSVRNISQGHIDFRHTRYISRKEFESMPWGSKPKRGDVLFCRVGTIGYPQIVETDDEFGIFVSLGFFRVIKEVILNKYIRYWMMSPFFYRQVSKNVIGSTLKNLNTGWLKNFLIPVPILAEQKTIVKKLDALLAETEKLEKIYEQKLANLVELKKSVLSKAFKGEL